MVVKFLLGTVKHMLKSDKLTYKYDDGTLAIEDVSVDFSKGKVIGVIGANGAGKTTLFKCLLGILKPSAGSVLFNGNPLSYKKKSLNELRKNITMIMQDPEKQIFHSNIYDDVAFGPRNLGKNEIEVEKIVMENLKAVDMWELREKPVHYISYGQKKRVAIAGAMALNPKLILMDEPTSGLDPRMETDMKEIIEKLKSEDKRVIISSHDMDLIYEICDYIYLIKDGKILKHGDKKDVFVDEDSIISAGLKLPWLVKLHKKMGMDLFSNESELFSSKK